MLTATETLVAAVTEALAPYAGLLDPAMREGRLSSLTIELKISHKTGEIRNSAVRPELWTHGAGR